MTTPLNDGLGRLEVTSIGNSRRLIINGRNVGTLVLSGPEARVFDALIACVPSKQPQHKTARED